MQQEEPRLKTESLRSFMNDSNEKKPGLKIHIDPAIATGHYVNFSVVNHSQTEFVLDSAYIQPQAPVAHVRSRLIMNPLYAKRFMQTLQKNIERYEARFGEIPVGDTPDPVTFQ